MKHLLFFFWIGMMVYGGSFLVSFGEHSSDFFQESVYKSITILNQFMVLTADVKILFVQKTLESGLLGVATSGICRDAIDNVVTIPPALRAQKYNDLFSCDTIGILPFYHFTVYITNDSTVSFYNGDHVYEMGRNQHDIVALLLHEELHGLGIETTIDQHGNFKSPPFFTIFDKIVFDLSATTSMTGLNEDQRNLLTNGSLSYTFDGHRYPLYSKTPFSDGTSIVHGKYGTLDWKVEKHILVRTLDAFTFHMLSRMGYTMKNCDAPDWITICGFCTAGSTCAISNGEKIHSFLF